MLLSNLKKKSIDITYVLSQILVNNDLYFYYDLFHFSRSFGIKSCTCSDHFCSVKVNRKLNIVWR